MSPILNRRSMIRTAAAVLLAALPFARRARAQAQLGLAERRAVAAYRDGTFAALLAEIRRAAGTDVEVAVDWDRIAVPGQAAQFDKPGFWTDIYFRPLIDALTAITADQIGREAVKAKLHRVVVTFDAATAPASNYVNGLKFADGTLTINFYPNSNAADIASRTAAIRQVLEANL